MTRGIAPRLRLFLAAWLLLPVSALLAAWTPTPASAANDSISAVVQVCTLPVGLSCNPDQPINGADWASSATWYGSVVWWRVVVTNTGSDPLTNISVGSSLPLPATDCEGSVPVPGNTLPAGASYGYVCETRGVAPPVSLTQTVTASGNPGSGLVFSATSAPAMANVQPLHFGYWLVGSDGGIFSFGSAVFHGSTGGIQLQRPVVGIVATADRGGYWLDASDGGVFSFGDTQFYGSIPGLGIHPAGSGLPHSLNAPIVGMVASHDQGGYFMVASDGGVFAFGDAQFAGSCPDIGGCVGAAVAVLPDASGNGYWLITSTGNVYAFGDAPYLGAPGHGTVTSAVGTPGGKGYWILLGDGEVFSYYGDAANLGSPPPTDFSDLDPATAIFATVDGAGYWVSSALGAVYNFGDAPNDGGMAGTHLNGSIIAASGS
jgi:uncharacterized repeat protein (TIGR01451 family)